MNWVANPYKAVEELEEAVRAYTGAPYAVAVDSCTHAIFLACKYCQVYRLDEVIIPKCTYVSVPAEIIHAGGRVGFADRDWQGEYQLVPTPIWDSAKRFTSVMYRPGAFQCLSLHFAKILDAGRGGMIIHDDAEADEWFRLARFSGRHPGVKLSEENIEMVGWHFTMDPVFAVQGLMRMSRMPTYNKDQEEYYQDLSQFKCFTEANRSNNVSYPIPTEQSGSSISR